MADAPGGVAAYVVGARRDGGAPVDWQDRVAALPDLRVIGRTRLTLHVAASPAAADRLRALFGDGLRVEALLSRSP